MHGSSMLDMGIHTSGGSDAPVVSFDAMENIYFAVTCKNIKGQPQEGWILSRKNIRRRSGEAFTKTQLTLPIQKTRTEPSSGKNATS